MGTDRPTAANGRRIGIGLVDPSRALPFAEMSARLRRAHADGFATAWIDHAFGWDSLTTLAVLGASVPDIELGTAVVPIYPRHPGLLAQQALTAAEVLDDRLVLGIGTSHKIAVEMVFGYSFERPARHTEEFMSVLLPLLREGRVEYTGSTVHANMRLKELPTSSMPVLLAALGPRMLHLAGSIADGTILWLANTAALRDYVMPILFDAAEANDRPSPRVVCALPVCVTDNPTAARVEAAERFAMYRNLPSYRAILDRSGATGPEDAAMIGDEEQVAEQMDALFEAGATDVSPAMFGGTEDVERTWTHLGALARAYRAPRPVTPV